MKPIADYFLFRRWASPREYRDQFGVDPPWDPSKPPKCWGDPAALASPRRSVVYDSALVTGPSGTILADPKGFPVTDLLVLPREQAAALNIPPDATNTPGADALEVQVPLKPLAKDEFLVFGALPGMAGHQVFVISQAELDAGPDAFTRADRALLDAILAAVNQCRASLLGIRGKLGA